MLHTPWFKSLLEHMLRGFAVSRVEVDRNVIRENCTNSILKDIANI